MPDKDTALCRTCSGRRNVVVLADEPVRTEEGFFGPTWSETRYRILACAGCGTRFFQTISINADDLIEHKDNDGEKSFGMMPKETFQYWPPFSHRKRPEWVDYDWTKKESLKSLLDETYTALDNDLGVLAAIGMRTVFDSASEELGINPPSPTSSTKY